MIKRYIVFDVESFSNAECSKTTLNGFIIHWSFNTALLLVNVM